MSLPVNVVNVLTRQQYQFPDWGQGRQFIAKMLNVEELFGTTDALGWAHYPNGWRMSHTTNTIDPEDWAG